MKGFVRKLLNGPRHLSFPHVARSNSAVAYPGGFLVARKPPPLATIFLNQGGDTVTGTDPHQPLTFATFGNPPWDQLWIRHCSVVNARDWRPRGRIPVAVSEWQCRPKLGLGRSASSLTKHRVGAYIRSTVCRHNKLLVTQGSNLTFFTTCPEGQWA